MRFIPYLNFDGTCREAFEFYAETFGGTIDAMIPHGGSPIEDQVPAEWHDLILHAHMTAGDTVIMASDSPPGRHEQPKGLYVHIGLEDPAEADRIFAALSKGGRVTMPLDRTFWAQRFGMVVDKYGTPWMVNCE